MTEPDDIDMLAGEYVLGTLDARERAEVAARRRREPGLDAAIQTWEKRLAPLDAATPSVEPPADFFARIERAIGSSASPVAGLAAPIAPAASSLDVSTVVDLLQRRMRRWRNLAVASTAIAASLAVSIGLRETIYQPKPQSFVAVFQKDDALPAFLMTIDLSTRELTVRPVGAERQQNRTYQLWIASDQLGPAPRSLGLLGDGAEPARKQLTDYEPSLLHRATFGVSLEPAGGSPTGRPTSPALHAKLYPATQDTR